MVPIMDEMARAIRRDMANLIEEKNLIMKFSRFFFGFSMDVNGWEFYKKNKDR